MYDIMHDIDTEDDKYYPYECAIDFEAMLKNNWN